MSSPPEESRDSGTWRASLRLRLLLLVFLAMLPAFGLISWSAYEERQAGLQETERQAERVAARIASAFGQLIEFTRQTLGRLTQDPDIRDVKNPQACAQRLAQVRKLNPAYGLMGVISRDGKTVCADVERALGVDLSDREYFRQAVATRRFSVSGFLIGRTTGMYIMVLALPVLDEQGAVTSVMFLSLDLAWLGNQLRQLPVPPGSNVALVDDTGTVMAMYPHGAAAIGHKIPEVKYFLAQRHTGRVGGVHVVGADGIGRVNVSVALPHTPHGSAFVRAAIPTADIIAQANATLKRNLLALAVVALLAFAAAWWFAGLLVVAPARRLIKAAESLGHGDMTARSQLKHGRDELGQLALHFDDMAARLQRLTRALRTLSAGNRSLLRAADETALLEETCRLAVREGGYFLAWVGYAKDGVENGVAPVAVAGGQNDATAAVEAYANDNQDPAASAIRQGTTQVIHNPTPPGEFPSQIAQMCLGACALALKVHGRTIGALTLCTQDPAAFDEAELELLEEMAADLAFGIQTVRDRREHERAEEKIRRMAYEDGLTGLPNRTQLELKSAQALQAARASRAHIAILAICLERFTQIQNAFGFAEGDRLIIESANRLRAMADPAWTVARLLSDRFAILIPGADAAAAMEAARRLSAEFQRPVAVAQVYAELSVSIGIAIYPEHGDEAPLLIRRSDVACVYAQSDGAGIELYRGGGEKENPERLQMMVDLRRAIEEDQLSLHYQSKIDVRTGETTGAEALLRWRHPVKGDLLPSAFIPDAEKMGLIKPLTYWVLKAVMRQLHDWKQESFAVPIAVNLSVQNFRDPALMDTVRDMMAQWQVPPESLQIEITESVLMEDAQAAGLVLEQMRALGLRILIDDFGTGYSSLRYLAALPVDVIKIDRSFIVQMEYRPEMRALVAAIVNMGHNLGLKSVAEGVDDNQQVSILRSIGCDEIQGFIYAKPQPAPEFRKWCLRQDRMRRRKMGAALTT